MQTTVEEQTERIDLNPEFREIILKLTGRTGKEVTQIWVLLELLKEKTDSYNKNLDEKQSKGY